MNNGRESLGEKRKKNSSTKREKKGLWTKKRRGGWRMDQKAKWVITGIKRTLIQRLHWGSAEEVSPTWNSRVPRTRKKVTTVHALKRKTGEMG